MIACVWWHKAHSQSGSGVEQYYYMSNKGSTINPRAWYQANSGWYVEGRYNYEAAKTGSVLAGKNFEKGGTVIYSLTPLAGVVVGKFNGIAIAENSTVAYRKFLVAVQTQYTFSLQNRQQNFLYGWADLSYRLTNRTSAGMSLQYTREEGMPAKADKGFFFKVELGKWELPLYFFNIENKEREMILGLIFTYK